MIGTLDKIEADFDIDAALVVQSPAVITTLVDGVIFDVYKLSEKDDSSYEFFYGEELVVSGVIQAAIPELSEGSDEYGSYEYITVDSLKLSDHDMNQGLPYYSPGCIVTLIEPGDYYVIFRLEAVAGSAEAIIRVAGAVAEITIKPGETVTALVTSSKVLVDGKDILFDAYNINGNNYFKLRDLATVVNGTAKQFGVTWDGEKKQLI